MSITLEQAAAKESRYLLGVHKRYPVVIESGNGCCVVDTAGRRYLDGISGIGVNALGYNHPRISRVIAEHAARCLHTSNLFYHPYQGELAERLCRLSGLDRAFFSNSGAEAIECALKITRLYARGRTKLVALHNSFHGRTFGALAILGQEKYRRPFEPLGPEVTFVAANDTEALARAVDRDTAAIVMEPVLGEGGVFPLDPGFLCRARELADRVDALLIIDETQCGLGRTGHYFAYQESGIRPDIVVTAKPLAAGLPLGVTLFTECAAAVATPGVHGTTFGGGPLVCRVALEFLAILDELLPHIREIAVFLKDGLTRLAAKHVAIQEVRAKGLMFGIQLDRPGQPVVRRALERGLLVNCTHDTVIRLLPPFTLSREEASRMLAILDEALQESVI